ncbi:hypothetical protein [Mucilaginibacter sp. HD30]
MVRSSALYLVIVITLVIGIICSSLIVVAYFYREQYERAFSYDALQNNLNSGINILIADRENTYEGGKKISLFGEDVDSVELSTTAWGIYDIGMVRAFAHRDTLSKVFSMAHTIDSAKWAALYLPDEDRPVSVSGKTMIKGNVFLPKSGVRQAYVDSKAYEGDKRLVVGKTFDSQKSLPLLNPDRISILDQSFRVAGPMNGFISGDSLFRSFFEPVKIVSMGKKTLSLDRINLRGNILIVSDTSITIESNAQLEQVMIFAPNIKVKKGFEGACQLFATDSIIVEPDCTFNYPSALGILRFKTTQNSAPAIITIGANVSFSGCIFAYEKSTERSKQPLINLGKQANISGQIYSPGLLGLNDGVVVNGSIFTGRFLYKSGFTTFENYIINTTVNAEGLSPYYLSSEIMPVAGRKRKVLQWLESR